MNATRFYPKKVEQKSCRSPRAEGKINERGFTIGETFGVEGQTLYTRFGDWFWLVDSFGLDGVGGCGEEEIEDSF